MELPGSAVKKHLEPVADEIVFGITQNSRHAFVDPTDETFTIDHDNRVRFEFIDGIQDVFIFHQHKKIPGGQILVLLFQPQDLLLPSAFCPVCIQDLPDLKRQFLF